MIRKKWHWKNHLKWKLKRYEKIPQIARIFFLYYQLWYYSVNFIIIQYFLTLSVILFFCFKFNLLLRDFKQHMVVWVHFKETKVKFLWEYLLGLSNERENQQAGTFSMSRVKTKLCLDNGASQFQLYHCHNTAKLSPYFELNSDFSPYFLLQDGLKMFFGRLGQWFGNSDNVHLPWGGRGGVTGCPNTFRAEQTNSQLPHSALLGWGGLSWENPTDSGAAQPAADVLVRGEAVKLLSTTHTEGEQYIWYNLPASWNPVRGKFGVLLFQAFVLSIVWL